MLQEQICHFMGLPFHIEIISVKNEYFHYHKDLEAILVLKGSIDVKICNLTYQIKEDDLLIVDTEDLHSLYSTDEANILLCLHIDLMHFEPDYPNIDFMIFVCESFTSESLIKQSEIQAKIQILKYYMAKIMMEYMEKSDGFFERMAEYINDFVYLLVDKFQSYTIENKEFKNALGSKNPINTERLSNIVKYIYEHYSEKITLEDLSELEHLNSYYISHLIKSVTGLSFQQFLNFVRMEFAEKFLIGTDKTLTEIALDCGFSRSEYLNKQFTSWYQYTPAEFRRKYQNQTLCYEDRRCLLEFDPNEAIKKMHWYLQNFSDTPSTYGLALPKSKNIHIQLNVKKTGASFQEAYPLSLAVHDPTALMDVNFTAYLTHLIQSFGIHGLTFSALIFKTIGKDELFDRHFFRILAQLLNAQITITFSGIADTKTSHRQCDLLLQNTRRYYSSVPQNAEIKLQKSSIEPYAAIKSDRDLSGISNIFQEALEKKVQRSQVYFEIMDSPKNPLFSTGTGLYTKNGLRKRSYYACYLLSFMMGQIIEQQDGLMATRENDVIKLLLYHAPEQSDEVINTIYKTKVKISLELPPKQYLLTQYHLNEKRCAWDYWHEMMEPEQLSDYLVREINRRTVPDMDLHVLSGGVLVEKDLDIPKNCTELLIFSPLE